MAFVITSGATTNDGVNGPCTDARWVEYSYFNYQSSDPFPEGELWAYASSAELAEGVSLPGSAPTTTTATGAAVQLVSAASSTAKDTLVGVGVHVLPYGAGLIGLVGGWRLVARLLRGGV